MYKFYIGTVLLPITPGAIKSKVGSNNTIVTLMNEGEINILKSPQLKEVTFDVTLPTAKTKAPYAFYGMDGKEAQAFLEYFYQLKVRKLPFPFIIAKMHDDEILPRFYEKMLATVEDYEQTEDASNGRDVTVSLTLKEYREYSTLKVHEVSYTDGSVSHFAERPRAKSYTKDLEKLVFDITSSVGVDFGE